jgi:hypothetical protein
VTEALQGRHLHVDCFAGLAGDMVLGALLDLGVPRAVVDEAISALGLPDLQLEVSSVLRGGLRGCKVDVRSRGELAGAAHGRDHDHDHVHYRVLRALLAERCPASARPGALAIFDALAEVEGARHGVAPAEVAFHELGAADSIADIVGSAAALAWLRPAGASLRPVPLGGGSIVTAHGRLPVPAPATLELLRGCDVEAGGEHELTTPTGAALARWLARGDDGSWRTGAMPAGRVLGTGWGAGTRELPGRPNLLRVVLLEPSAAGADSVEVLEANLDDLSPALAAPLLEALLAAGALDAWFTPIVMKKGRPALIVSALAPLARRVEIEAVFFRESTTLGVRRARAERTTLAREIVHVETELGPVAVKLAGAPGPDGRPVDPLTRAPELEDCRRLAQATGVPLRRVHELAVAAAAAWKRT